MWSQGSIERGRRTIEALSQAASIGSFAVVVSPVAVPAVVAAVAFSLGHVWIGAFAAGAAAMFIALVLILIFPLHGALRRIFYGFRLQHVEITLEIDAGSKQIHRRVSRFLVKVVRTGTRRIPDRYCAPGPGVETRRLQAHAPRTGPGHAPRVRSGQARIVGLLWDSDDECWNYLMDLGAPLSSGTQRELLLEQAFDFRDVGYEPRLQRTILDPTDRLTLRVQISEERWPVNADGEELLPGGRPRALPVSIDEHHREITLDVSKPKFGHIYRIRWSSVSPPSETPMPAVDSRWVGPLSDLTSGRARASDSASR